MEKLQPLLKHKFWIIGGVVLLVTLVGWWIGTSAKAAYIEQRWATLSALQVAPGSNTPNQDYIDQIGKVIEVLDKRQDVLDNRLYESQKSLHTWPRNVAKYMDGKQFRDPASYSALQIYAREHYDEYMAMVKQLPLYTWDDNGGEYGIVYVQDIKKPDVKFKDDEWNDFEIIVTGKKAEFKCNGETLKTLDVKQEKSPLGLRAELGPVQIRHFRIKEGK